MSLTIPVPANIYSDRTGVEIVMGQCGVDSRLNDSETTVISAAEEQTLTTLIYYCSQEIDMFLLNRYPASQLTTSYLVYMWCSVMVAYRLGMRRCGSVPQALQWEYEQTMEKLRQIQIGQMDIGGLQKLSGPGAIWSNVRLDGRFREKQMRVEPNISNSTPTPYPQHKDLVDVWIQERDS